MLQSDALPLRRWLDGAAGPPRHFWGARRSVAFSDLRNGSSFGGRLGAFQGRSVLVATRDQLDDMAALLDEVIELLAKDDEALTRFIFPKLIAAPSPAAGEGTPLLSESSTNPTQHHGQAACRKDPT